MKSGIYTITNIVNGKMYVGYTKNFKTRKNSHVNKLDKNKHCNIYLQRAWNEYGKQFFKFEILVECEEDFLPSEENYWCNLLNTHNKIYGYNIEPTNPEGKRSTSEYTRIKMREAHINRPVNYDVINKLAQIVAIKVNKYTIEGVYIKTYNSITQAAQETGLLNQNIGKCCKNTKTRCSCGGFRWRIFDGSTDNIDPLPSKKYTKRKTHPWTGKKHSEETKKKISNASIGRSKTRSAEGEKRRLEGIKSYNEKRKKLTI